MSTWTRVNRNDRCPICGKDSWCTYNESVVLCMRVQSDFEKQFKDGSVGWIHRVGNSQERPRAWVNHPKPEVTIDAQKLMDQFCEETRAAQVQALALNLGVSVSSLRALGCAYARGHAAYAFPMFTGNGKIVGIRLRALDGRKWAVKGSKQGIFMSFRDGSKRGFVCEGPTDTAAALTLGFYAVGRPHCAGGMVDVGQVFNRAGIREAVIVADNDGPGLRGAEMLRRHLKMRTAILVLPCKDIRQFLIRGGNRDDLNSIVDNLAWRSPTSAGS